MGANTFALKARPFVLPLAVLLTVGIFLLLLNLPIGTAGGVLYLLPLLVAAWSPSRYAVLLLAVACSVLAIMGALLSPSDVSTTSGFVSLLIAMGTIWATALVVKRHQAVGAELQHTASLLAQVEQVAHLGAWHWDIPTNTVTWSDELYRIFGLSPREFQATYEAFESCVHPDDRERVREDIDKARLTHAAYAQDFRIIRPDGQVRVIYSQGEVFLNKAREPIRIVGVAQDLTDRKSLEEQLRQAQKMEAIGLLAGGVAHDFNNLLMVINGRSQLMLAGLSASDPLRNQVEPIIQAGEMATALTQQLLAFSRRQLLQPKVLDLNAIVAKIRPMLERVLGEHIDLATVLDPALGPVKADPGQLEQVIMNLVLNARDAMPQGGKLTIETANVKIREPHRHEQMVKPGHYAQLTVSDTGPGMDAQTQARIFEPFFSTKELGKGTGLGLSTVYGIVKQSGGYIFVYSELSYGTMFNVYLPKVEEAVAPTDEAPEDGERPCGTETILLVEDQPAVRAFVRGALQLLGYRVLEARHGFEALIIGNQHPGPIHLLLTDVVMPQMSGQEVAKRLVSSRLSMKVLYMSGYAERAMVHQGVLDQGTAFLQKPCSTDALARKVREVLDK